MKELFTIFVLIGSSFMLKTTEKTVNMVNFTGRAEGELFKGNILPGGVDTQTYTSEGGSLSARYMLEGTDSTGHSCRVFIENSVTPSMPQGTTHPTILTDSEFLQTKLKGERIGKMEFRDSCLLIHIY